MDIRQLQITKTAISNGWINLRPCGFDFFPSDAFGKSTKKNKGKEVFLYVKGFDHPIVTDIPTDLSGRPRWFFRDRSWTRQFVHLHKLRLEDKVNIIRLSDREYAQNLYIVNWRLYNTELIFS